MPAAEFIPHPLFDTLEYLKHQELPAWANLPFQLDDFKAAKDFLMQYDGNRATFESYRREVERLLQWAWLIAKKSILILDRSDMEEYIQFCLKPPKSWIGTKTVARFIDQEGKRAPNPAWRVFVASVSKSDHHEGIAPDIKRYLMSQKALREVFTVLSSFYNYLIYDNVIDKNPIAQIRQKSKFLRKQQSHRKIPKLSELQWSYCIEMAEKMAAQNPAKYERTLFIMTALYLMYLRISELVASVRWQPQMGHFYKDSNGNWFFMTVGKGNKERHISVSDDMLKALRRYRTHLGLSPLPAPNESAPLIYKQDGKNPIASDRQIRFIVQECFDTAVTRLREDNFAEDADALAQATVHWLRHTGISDDINKRHRPIPHVRDDAGHSSSAITDLYNDIEEQARYFSAKNKKVK
jgi:site-specific recombinase XerD